jgi:isopenicillin N synthase-like dioxygenase
MKLAQDVMEQAKSFFALPMEKKMEVCTELIPDEYCGYHPMSHYNPNGWKKRGWFSRCWKDSWG